MASRDNEKTKLEGVPASEKHQTTRNSNFLKAMRNSLNGIWMILVRERNMRIHIVLAFLILVAGLHYGIYRADWLWVTMAVFIVIFSEFLNTIIEAVVDLVVEKKYHPLAKLAKDVAAGAVLVAVGVEIVILLLIFQPYVWRQFGIVTNFSDLLHQFQR
ncbi:diacylglycerol kinase family protein [Leuconostoc carnosum]|nr:diacylglycerol kinase family protein [Leuconostoc carnosum]KAA8328397.1 diacylglycerol kinase family protein [Leuconostoc carnosum]KAA8359589.1 diacylglycerol kinase family protein [Leuconostoc carnosum]KAA8365164.1 diacylglycerol kinase family protein [Leuconostoc carnosum]KAA8367533.1 diacylglycerol kinase family protein [Leuconostoc carnosum]KAA8370952.1 diacylglycerol kinase family protein [Leuconostoc carnosum]